MDGLAPSAVPRRTISASPRVIRLARGLWPDPLPSEPPAPTARGANPSTFYGLAGVGDLILTCTGDLSRNRTVGVRLGKGETLLGILDDMKMVAEGVKTTRSAHDLARKHGIEMPIVEQIYLLLYKDKDARACVKDLMLRTLKAE